MFLWSAAILAIVLLLYYLWGHQDNPKAPPGPRPWPILGNLVHMARASNNLVLTFSEMGKVYGEIFSLKMGMKSTVVLTSREAIETILTNEAAFGRDRSGMLNDRSYGKNLGIVTSEGEIWEKSRTWAFKHLREYGFNKSFEMENYIHNAAANLFSQIEEVQKRNGWVHMDLLFSYSIFAIMWQLIVGKLTEKDKSTVKLISEKSELFIQSSVFGAGLSNAYPFLRFIFPKSMGYTDQMNFFTTCNKIAEKLYIETKSDFQSGGPPTSFTEEFISNANAEKDPKLFNCENFQLVFQDLMLGSSETTNSYMESLILNLILFPDVQENVYQEILQVAPEGGLISFSDRKKMVYTQAVLLEGHRAGRVLQNFVPRKALKDVAYKDYIIKKGTVIIVDTHLYYTDEKRWPDPDSFRPERFINDKGEICNANDVISFSVGKRNCPGEQYAGIMSFLLLTSILQRYRLAIPPGKAKPRADPRPGLTFKPYPFDVCFIPRK